MEPGIISDPRAAFAHILEPIAKCISGDAAIFKQAFIHLLAHLHGVPAINEDCGVRKRDRGETGRSAKAGEPAQTLRIIADILAHMFIGNRHDKSIELAALQFLAEGLETGFMGLHQHCVDFLLTAPRLSRRLDCLELPT